MLNKEINFKVFHKARSDYYHFGLTIFIKNWLNVKTLYMDFFTYSWYALGDCALVSLTLK